MGERRPIHESIVRRVAENDNCHVERVRNFVVPGVECPFCNKQMIRSSVSGNQEGVREGHYRCDEGHRVSLTADKSGGLGWK